jgi:hypothetical protein
MHRIWVVIMWAMTRVFQQLKRDIVHGAGQLLEELPHWPLNGQHYVEAAAHPVKSVVSHMH